MLKEKKRRNKIVKNKLQLYTVRNLKLKKKTNMVFFDSTSTNTNLLDSFLYMVFKSEKEHNLFLKNEIKTNADKNENT